MSRSPDRVSGWRETDEAFRRVDASGTLPDGSKFNGLAEFRATLLKSPERFVTTVTESC